MALTIGTLKETVLGEARVAIVPEVVKKLSKLGVSILVERGAGMASHILDAEYEAAGATLKSGDEVYDSSDIILKIQAPSLVEISKIKAKTYLLASLAPEKNLNAMQALAQADITAWATEYIPRITRAQSMDTLSSQAAAAGYKGVLKAASLSTKFFPMLTTAAGTIRPAKVLVLGAGVAGLQAIATARRLGAVVEAYDIRPETKEQCESLGAKFIETGIDARGEGGYARELTAEELEQQKDIVDTHIARSDVVITTAAIPGRPSPKLLSANVISQMKSGSVVVDLASEGGGNCELTQPGETVNVGGVIIDGPLNVAAELSVHTSEMFSKNLFNFISPFINEGQLNIDWDDEVISKSCVTRDGILVHERLNQKGGEA